MKKLVLSSFILVLGATTAKSQYATGVDVSYKVFFGDDMSTPALGISFINHLGDGDVMFYSGGAFGFPKTASTTTLAYAHDQFNPVQTVNVNLTTKYFSAYFDLGIGKYFDGDYEDGGLIGFGGVTSCLISGKTTIGNYDQSNYHLDYSGPGINETRSVNMAYGVKGGLAYLIRFGSMGLMPYADISIPVIKPEDTNFPVYLGIGARFSFFAE